MASAMIKPLIPIYVVLVLNQGMDKLGYVLAITTFVFYLLRWIGGYLSDKFQVTKPLLLIGYSLSAVMKPLLNLTTSWTGVAAISATEGLVLAFCKPRFFAFLKICCGVLIKKR